MQLSRKDPAFLVGLVDAAPDESPLEEHEKKKDDAGIDYTFFVTLITPKGKIHQGVIYDSEKPFLRFYWDVARCNELLPGQPQLLSEQSEADLFAALWDSKHRSGSTFDVILDESRTAVPMDHISVCVKEGAMDETPVEYQQFVMATYRVSRELPDVENMMDINERPRFQLLLGTKGTMTPNGLDWFDEKSTIDNLKQRLKWPSEAPLVLRDRLNPDHYYFTDEYHDDLVEVLKKMISDAETAFPDRIDDYAVYRGWLEQDCKRRQDTEPQAKRTKK